MAKALINRGVPIKADDPKDPYIRDASGINEIVNANKTFGKTLGTANGKIQLKNGNTVLSEVDAFSLYTESKIQTSGGSEIDTSTTPNTYNGSALTDPFEVGKYYAFWTYGEYIAAHNTLTVVDNYYNPTTTVSIDCSDIDDDIPTLYFKVTAIDGGNITAVGYASQPTEKVNYEKPIKVGDNLSIENDTLKATSGGGIVRAEVDDYNLKFTYSGGSTQNIPIPTLSVKRFTISEDNGTYTFDDGVKAKDVMNAVDNLNEVELVVSMSSNMTQNKIFRLGYYQDENELTFQDPLYSFVCIHNLDNSATALTVENIVLTNKNATTVTINTKTI